MTKEESSGFGNRSRTTRRRKSEAWPFTAILLPNHNILVTLTHSNQVVELDPDGKVVWHISNADFPQKPFADPCGAQRLLQGNTVIASYGAKEASRSSKSPPTKRSFGPTRSIELTKSKSSPTTALPCPTHHSSNFSVDFQSLERHVSKLPFQSLEDHLLLDLLYKLRPSCLLRNKKSTGLRSLQCVFEILEQIDLLRFLKAAWKIMPAIRLARLTTIKVPSTLLGIELGGNCVELFDLQSHALPVHS